MPMDKSRYPANWAQISLDARQRADNKCEECGVENHVYGWRRETGEFVPLDSWDGSPVQVRKIIRIVLTVSHTDHDTTNNHPSNLRALCQRCHLTHDAKLHSANAAETRRRKKLVAGQQTLGAL